MTRHSQFILWFGIPFILTLTGIVGLRLWYTDAKTVPLESIPAYDSSSLMGHAISTKELLEARSRNPITEQGLSIPDTAIVILLGGASCSSNQVNLLRYWSEKKPESGLPDYPILAVYADPFIGVEQGFYESLLLRRVSQTTFPFLVSQDSTFNLRAMGIPTPQVVLAESRIITHIFDQPAELRPPAPQ